MLTRLLFQVFPGGLLPSLTFLITSITKASAGRLVVDSVSNIGPHYSRTLREWQQRFTTNFSTIEKGLTKAHPGVFEGPEGQRELDVFYRKWICGSYLI